MERDSRNVRLTAEGQYFYEQAVLILEQSELAASTVGRMAKGETGRVQVGFMEIAMDSLVPEAIRTFRNKFSGVSVLISQLGATVQLERIRTGELDVGFSTVFMHGMEGLESLKLFSKKHVLAVPDDHLFTRKKKLTLKDIAKDKLIMFPRAGQPDLYDSMMEAFSKKGLEPIISQEVAGLSGAAALISSGMGVAFLPDNSHVSRKGITLIPIMEDFPLMDIYMVWNKDSCSNAAKKFMESVADYFAVSSVADNGSN